MIMKETELDIGLCVMMWDDIKILRFEKKIGKNRKKIGKNRKKIGKWKNSEYVIFSTKST